MNFLRRRLSDSSFVANLPNGYMMDLQRPDNSTSSPVSPAMDRKQQPPPPPASASTGGTSLFSSITNAVKQTTQAAAGLVEPTGAPAAPPVVLKPKVLLVIDDPHTDWTAFLFYFLVVDWAPPPAGHKTGKASRYLECCRFAPNGNTWYCSSI
ncbi:hypothetical protein XELAEV_18019816mg [Xenopus laevis]|uniref:Uncharacterized protein n=1 Tax=Xenopus laevis TaxID=8355 RepID=A0A974D6I3_XENLA|nr:hypothetical protein XELAEV_18019816mg [Xenopus laevis]